MTILTIEVGTFFPSFFPDSLASDQIAVIRNCNDCQASQIFLVAPLDRIKPTKATDQAREPQACSGAKWGWNCSPHLGRTG